MPSRRRALCKEITIFCLLVIVLFLNGHPVSAKSYIYTTQDLLDDDRSLPSFKLPWPEGLNGQIYWTSGPHSWSKGGLLTAKVSASRANGLDFGRGGASWDVVAMASGVVIKNRCGFAGLGCIVAIRHDVGGSVMVYAHLEPNIGGSAPNNELQEGMWVQQKTKIGRVGQSGGQTAIHLHIELRDGGICYAPADGINGDDCHTGGDPSIGFAGSPIGWDGQRLIDNYFINGYFDSDSYCGPGADCDTIYNYDGSAIYGHIGAPYIKFPYNDSGIQRQVLAFVHPNFIDNNTCTSTTNCEINAVDGTTVFAYHGVFVGGGGLLNSTNSAIDPPSTPDDTVLPSGYFVTPSTGTTIYGPSVQIIVSASDNSGGSGVKEVRFSAKWGGSWKGIGNDATAPYSINWDMCSSGVVDNEDIELGMEVWDNAENKYVWSEHGTNPHIKMNYSCSSGDPLDGGPWDVVAWQNKYLAGYVNWEGTVTWADGYPYIYYDWGSGAPFGWGGDDFSMRLTRSIYFPGGYYEFHTKHDDGVKVYIDGNIVINAWWDGNGGHDNGRNLSQGFHEVKVEYYENSGDAKLQVYWYGEGYPPPDTAPPLGRITNPAHLSATNQTSVLISADASDDVSGVNRVVFYAWYCHQDVCDWRTLITDYSAPYEYYWDWSAIGDKHVWFDIVVVDNLGKSSNNLEGFVELDLDITNPLVEFNYPESNLYLHDDMVHIDVYAIDAQSGIDSVQFFAGYEDGSSNYWHEIGWDNSASENHYNLNWDGSGVPFGKPLSLFVYAYDNAGNYSGSAVWNVYMETNLLYIPLVLHNYLYTVKPIFVYPLNGQTLGYNNDWMFKVEPINGAQGYLWGFKQGDVFVWENLSYEGTLSSNEYAISVGTEAHNAFSPGSVVVMVRAWINGEWTEAAEITIYLE